MLIGKVIAGAGKVHREFQNNHNKTKYSQKKTNFTKKKIKKPVRLTTDYSTEDEI